MRLVQTDVIKVFSTSGHFLGGFLSSSLASNGKQSSDEIRSINNAVVFFPFSLYFEH